MDEDITPELAAKLDADRREAWQAMSFGERLLAGAAMFDVNAMMMRTGIRLEIPNADEEFVERKFLEKLRNARRFEART